jgi:four helix bundle protein
MRLEELRVYELAMNTGESVWKGVARWDFFAKDTVGKQWVRAIDSVAANLSEGFGRFHYKENKHHCYYSRGSLFESKTWATKAHQRDLISQEQFDEFMKDIDNIGIKLNNYIRSIGPTEKNDRVKEATEPYGTNWDDNDVREANN